MSSGDGSVERLESASETPSALRDRSNRHFDVAVKRKHTPTLCSRELCGFPIAVNTPPRRRPTVNPGDVSAVLKKSA